MKRSFSTRALEIFPGALTWTALLIPFILAYPFPEIIIIYVLIFDIYWLFQSAFLAVNTVRVYRKLSRAKKVNWHQKMLDLNSPKYTDLVMAIILVHYKESYALVDRSLQSYIQSDFPLEKIIFIMASEKRNEKEAKEIFFKLKEKYGTKFKNFVQTMHPDNLTGEIRGKSANETWAGKWLKDYCDKNNLKYSQVLLNNFDADTRVYPQYFSHLTYTFLTTPNGEYASYQPIHIYENNIWETFAIMRIVSMSATLIYMSNTLRPFRFHNFSSRSDCFQTVVDIGFWDPDIIPEDARQYYKSFFYYKGNNNVVPLYIPLRMDAVYSGNFWTTMQNQYRQLRRWAWGISDFPYIFKRSVKDKEISFSVKFIQLFSLLESHFTWATAPLYVSIMGWVPIVLNPNFKDSIIAVNFPYYSRFILSFALIGFATMIVLSYFLLPPLPKNCKKNKYVYLLFQWLLAPVISVLITSFAGIDSQTRLMLGKRLDYQVTEKKAVV